MCNHSNVTRKKVIKLKLDRYLQTINFCQNCHKQMSVKLTELKAK